MSFGTCKTCEKSYVDLEWHKCPPIYLAWCPSDDETVHRDAREIRASNHEYAAEEWARKDDWDSAEFRIANGDELTVHVVSKEDYDKAALSTDDDDFEVPEDKIKRFIVTGEYDPTYIAREVTSD